MKTTTKVVSPTMTLRVQETFKMLTPSMTGNPEAFRPGMWVSGRKLFRTNNTLIQETLWSPPYDPNGDGIPEAGSSGYTVRRTVGSSEFGHREFFYNSTDGRIVVKNRDTGEDIFVGQVGSTESDITYDADYGDAAEVFEKVIARDQAGERWIILIEDDKITVSPDIPPEKQQAAELARTAFLDQLGLGGDERESVSKQITWNPIGNESSWDECLGWALSGQSCSGDLIHQGYAVTLKFNDRNFEYRVIRDNSNSDGWRVVANPTDETVLEALKYFRNSIGFNPPPTVNQIGIRVGTVREG